MPTLDDLPTLATAAVTGDDLIPVYDLTAEGSSKVRKLSLNAILGLAPTGEIVTTPSAANVTIANRLTYITGTTATLLAFPAASGVLRDLTIVNLSTAVLTVPTLAAGSTTNWTNGAGARFLSNGTGWYRVS